MVWFGVCFFDLRRYAKTDSRPCVVCPPSLAASHFLLLAQEKVTKEKGTLAAAVAGHPCPATTRGRSGGSLTVRPCTGSERARILRAPLRAFSSAPSPRPRGTREEQSAAVPAAEARRQRPSSCSCFALLLGPSVTRRRADGQGPRTARGGARDRAHFAAGHGWPVGKTPAARSAPGAQRRARHRGCVLFGYFLLHKQEKVTRPARMAGRNYTGT